MTAASTAAASAAPQQSASSSSSGDGGSLLCSECHRALPKSHYSGTQLKRKGKRICHTCVDVIASGLSSMPSKQLLAAASYSSAVMVPPRYQHVPHLHAVVSQCECDDPRCIWRAVYQLEPKFAKAEARETTNFDFTAHWESMCVPHLSSPELPRVIQLANRYYRSMKSAQIKLEYSPHLAPAQLMGNPDSYEMMLRCYFCNLLSAGDTSKLSAEEIATVRSNPHWFEQLGPVTLRQPCGAPKHWVSAVNKIHDACGWGCPG